MLNNSQILCNPKADLPAVNQLDFLHKPISSKKHTGLYWSPGFLLVGYRALGWFQYFSTNGNKADWTMISLFDLFFPFSYPSTLIGGTNFTLLALTVFCKLLKTSANGSGITPTKPQTAI